ncbi:MAG: hypothetical protein AAFN59_08475 [Pseudomonadota bacterium]
MLEPCTQVVSLLTALVFGANGACVELSPASLAPFIVAFILAVVVMQYLARRLIAMIFVPPAKPDTHPSAPPNAPLTKRGALLDGPTYDGGPIQSTRR